VHQFEDMVSGTVRVTAERSVCLSENPFQVVEQLVRSLKVVSQVMNASGVMCHGVDVCRNSIELQSVVAQMVVPRFVSVMSRELAVEFAGLRLHLDRERVDVVVRISVG